LKKNETFGSIYFPSTAFFSFFLFSFFLPLAASVPRFKASENQVNGHAEYLTEREREALKVAVPGGEQSRSN